MFLQIPCSCCVCKLENACINFLHKVCFNCMHYNIVTISSIFVYIASTKRMIKPQVIVLLAIGTIVTAVICLAALWHPGSPRSLLKPVKEFAQTSKDNLLYDWPTWSADYNSTLVEKSLHKKGYSVTDLPHWSTLWTNKIHLCVMFNLKNMKPKKKVTDLLVSYYYPFFRNITLIFDGVSERPEFVPDFVDVIGCDAHDGWYQHKCIRSCLQRGTEETKGYLYIADDMLINLTKMANLPATQLWYIEIEGDSWTNIQSIPRDWQWWGPPYNGAKKLKHAMENFPAEWVEELKKTAGFPDNFKVKSTSDMIYIPCTLVPKMIKVLSHIIDTTPDLFCEIATGLAVDVVAPQRVVFNLSSYLWYDRSIKTIQLTAKTSYFVHPVKLGIPQYAKLWVECMEQQLYNTLMVYK